MMFVPEGHMLNVNGALTRGLTLYARHCAGRTATQGEKKETREVQAPDPLELGPAQGRLRRWIQ